MFGIGRTVQRMDTIKPLKTNGIATYEAWLYGGNRKVHSMRARITAKRVTTGWVAWDHQGHRITAYRTGPKHPRLLSFQIDGGEPVIVAQPSPASFLTIAGWRITEFPEAKTYSVSNPPTGSKT